MPVFDNCNSLEYIRYTSLVLILKPILMHKFHWNIQKSEIKNCSIKFRIYGMFDWMIQDFSYRLKVSMH